MLRFVTLPLKPAEINRFLGCYALLRRSAQLGHIPCDAVTLRRSLIRKQGLDMTVEVVEAHIKGLISEGKLHYSSASDDHSRRIRLHPAPTIADRRTSLSWALAEVEAWAGPRSFCLGLR